MKFSTQALAGVLGIAILVAAFVALRRDHAPAGGDSVESLETKRPARGPASGGATKSPDLSRWQPLVDDSLPTEERLNVARAIRADLSPEETGFLFSALDHEPRSGSEREWWMVMNEIMEQMRKHGAGADQYTERFIALLEDSGRHPVVRDYAIQQLSQWIAPFASEISPGETDPARQARALAAIGRVTRDPSLVHTSIPGTALMALADLSSRLPGETVAPVWEDLRPFLGEVISGNHEAGVALRTSAIQAVAVHGEASHLPVIRGLARDEATDASVRLSSIAALGFYADPADQAFLRELTTSDTRYRYAAQAALQRSSAR